MLRSPTLSFGPVRWVQAGMKAGALAARALGDRASPTVARTLTPISAAATTAPTTPTRTRADLLPVAGSVGRESNSLTSPPRSLGFENLDRRRFRELSHVQTNTVSSSIGRVLIRIG